MYLATGTGTTVERSPWELIYPPPVTVRGLNINIITMNYKLPAIALARCDVFDNGVDKITK